MSYFDALCRAMSMLAEHPRLVFMGQSVAVPGTAMYHTLKHLPAEKLIEMPVFEATQLGLATGMAIAGDLPVCVFPRWNFLLEAAGALVNGLDKCAYRPCVIVRTAVPTPHPLHPGPQHLGDFTDAFRLMLHNTVVERLLDAEDIVPAYERAMRRAGSTVLVELTEKYA